MPFSFEACMVDKTKKAVTACVSKIDLYKTK